MCIRDRGGDGGETGGGEAGEGGGGEQGGALTKKQKKQQKQQQKQQQRRRDGVTVTLTDGSTLDAALLVGSDGLFSPRANADDATRFYCVLDGFPPCA